MPAKISSQPEIAHDDQISPEENRRTYPRIQTVLRVGRVTTDQDEGLARVRNLSDRGAQLRLQIPVMLGDTLKLELADGVTLWGVVIWSSGDDCGLRFDQSIDCSELLTKLAAWAKQGVSRPARLAVTMSAVVSDVNGKHQTNVIDISQLGMKLSHDGGLVQGLAVQIKLLSGVTRMGVVRWSQEKVAGVRLLEPFSADELGSARNLMNR